MEWSVHAMLCYNSTRQTTTTNIADLNSKVENIEETIEETVVKKFEALKDTWDENVDTKIEEAKDAVKEHALGDVNDLVMRKLTEMGIPDMITRQNEMEDTIKELKRLVDRPFDPERSVVVYGLADKEGDTIDTTVSWLLKDILELQITPKFYERTTAKGDKPGVLKIELFSAFDKVALLRAKKKCEKHDLTKKVRISSCDSHDARVAKINTRFVLNRLPNAKDYIVSANGVIRQKATVEDDSDSKNPPDENATPPESEHVAAGSIVNNGDERPEPSAPESAAKSPERPNPKPKSDPPATKKPDRDPKNTPKASNPSGPTTRSNKLNA